MSLNRNRFSVVTRLTIVSVIITFLTGGYASESSLTYYLADEFSSILFNTTSEEQAGIPVIVDGDTIDNPNTDGPDLFHTQQFYASGQRSSFVFGALNYFRFSHDG